MKDQKTLAYINLFGILGALGKLAELDDAARALLTGIKPISLGIAVSGGPHATLRFADGGCVQTEGVDRCDIKIAFSTAEKFNGMIDGTVTPIPRKGFTHIGFLTGTFVKLTDILTRYLRPSAEDLADERFFEVSTTLMLYVIAGAVAQIGNHDEVGRFSASNIVDGDVLLSIKGGPQATVTAQGPCPLLPPRGDGEPARGDGIRVDPSGARPVRRQGQRDGLHRPEGNHRRRRHLDAGQCQPHLGPRGAVSRLNGRKGEGKWNTKPIHTKTAAGSLNAR